MPQFDEALLARARDHLAAFPRRATEWDGLRPAAVAVVLLGDDEARACFLLTRRAAALRVHAGQWALPGGRIEDGERAEGAALRELWEEVGLGLGGESVLGLLDDYPTRSGYLITPIVVWAPDEARMSANPAEVEAIYRVQLAELGRPGSPEFVAIPESDQPVIRYPLLGTLIHAPTAAVMYQFIEVAVHGRATRVAHLEQPVWAWS